MRNDEIKETLVSEVCSCLETFVEGVQVKYPNETFYGFVFYFDSDMDSFCLMANSEESLERVNDHYKQEHDLKMNTRWMVNEWAYDDEGIDGVQSLRELVSKTHSDMGAEFDQYSTGWNDIKLFIYSAVTEGMKRYSTTSRPRGIYLSICEGDSEFMGVVRHFYSSLEHNSPIAGLRFAVSQMFGLGLLIALLGAVYKPFKRGF